MRIAVHDARMGEKRNLYKGFEGKPARKNIRKTLGYVRG